MATETKDDSITLSPKYGVNPSIAHCICCGKSIGVALLGELKGDVEAPRDIYDGLCDECESVVKREGALIIETRDGESGNNPYRTGRYVGISKDCKERLFIEHPLSFMEHTLFEKLFGHIYEDEETAKKATEKKRAKEEKEEKAEKVEKKKPKTKKETKVKTSKIVKKKTTNKNKEKVS